jgi:hypothetical protein
MQAQKQDQGHFLVEFDQFSPPVQELIASFENSPAPPFLAADLDGIEHYSKNYQGKYLLIWFWSVSDQVSMKQLVALNEITPKAVKKFQIISFGEESKAELLDFRETQSIDFPVIFQSKILGEAAYGGDLGLGRVFIVDEQGIVQKVLPRSAFQGENHGMEFIRQYFSLNK